MKFLISGHPRTRSAWLCALFNAHGERCYHDVLVNGVALDDDSFGISDPGVACLRPDAGLKHSTGKPRICITRPAWRPAFEKWVGTVLTDNEARDMEQNVNKYMRTLGTLQVDYRQLNDNHCVARLVTLCTQKPACMDTIRIFQQLHIEQHQAKAHSAFSLGRSMSTMP